MPQTATPATDPGRVVDPLELAGVLWPHVRFYREQREIIYSVWDNDRTVVPAGHMLGKDFVAGFVCLAFFLTRHPCRVVTTSVDGAQLEGVLWGEIRNFILTSRYPLDAEKGGPLIINHLHLRKVVGGRECGLSYCIGRVAAKGEGLSGHHVARTGDGVPRTLLIADEASGVDQKSFDKGSEWAERMLVIGNPYACQNAFRWAVKGKPGGKDRGGDVPRPCGNGYSRRVIKIRGEDSPNVRLALAQRGAGLAPTGEMLVPGVLPWDEYQTRRATWDPVKQCVGLDAEFYEGSDVLLFPPQWLDRAARLAASRPRNPKALRAVGVDTGEGVAETSMACVDEGGLLELQSRKTPDTSVIRGEVLAFARKWDVPAERVAFDRGGGGKQIADELRRDGFNVRTVAFGEAVVPEPRRGMATTEQRLSEREERYAYANRRAQMYGELRLLLDPSGPGFALPAEYAELRRQLAPIPLTYDREGRLELLPKNARGDGERPSLVALIGCSPDQADALVLAVHALRHKSTRARAGAR